MAETDVVSDLIHLPLPTCKIKIITADFTRLQGSLSEIVCVIYRLFKLQKAA